MRRRVCVLSCAARGAAVVGMSLDARVPRPGLHPFILRCGGVSRTLFSLRPFSPFPVNPRRPGSERGKGAQLP